MFEDDQEIVNSLLNKSNTLSFSSLKSTVKEANKGNVGMDQFSLEELKKAKLDLKDRMSLIIENHKQVRV